MSDRSQLSKILNCVSNQRLEVTGDLQVQPKMHRPLGKFAIAAHGAVLPGNLFYAAGSI